jgi:hypothetical protein
MATSFARYSGLLAHEYVSYETIAGCSRLILANAKLNTLIAVSRGLGHETGPTGRSEWVAITQRSRLAMKEFDDAWAEYLQKFTRDSSRELDDGLRLAVFGVLNKVETLVTEFSGLERYVDW